MDDAHAAETHESEMEDHEMTEAEHDEPAEAAGSVGKPVDIQQLAEVIGTMSRFVSKLTEAAPVKSEGLGLVEWLSLRQIAAGEGLRQNQLSNSLGVTRQRGNHITKSLSNSGLITMATVEGSKAATLSVTVVGREKATAIDEAVMGLLGPKLDGKGGSIAQLRKRLVQNVEGDPSSEAGRKEGQGRERRQRTQETQAHGHGWQG